MEYNIPESMRLQQNQRPQPQQDDGFGRIQYLYDMAQANPTNSGLANAYMEEYMNYMYPQQQQQDPYEQALNQMLGLGGGQQQSQPASLFEQTYGQSAETWGQQPQQIQPQQQELQIEVPDSELRQVQVPSWGQPAYGLTNTIANTLMGNEDYNNFMNQYANAASNWDNKRLQDVNKFLFGFLGVLHYRC